MYKVKISLLSVIFFAALTGTVTSNAMITTENKKLSKFKKNPITYIEKDLSQATFCDTLTELKDTEPENFKKLCYEKIETDNPDGHTLLTKVGKLFLWEVGLFLVNNAPRNDKNELLVSLDLQDSDGNTALHYFIDCPSVSNPSVNTDTSSQNSLYLAAKKYGCLNNVNKTIFFKKRGSNFQNECKSIWCSTAIEGEQEFWKKLSEVAQALILARAKLELQNKNSETPLHLWAKNGNYYVFTSLKDKLTYTLINMRDKNGNTIAHLITYQYLYGLKCRGMFGMGNLSKELCQTLQSHKIDLTIKNNEQKSPKQILQETGVGTVLFTEDQKKSLWAPLTTYWKPLVTVTCIAAATFIAYKIFFRTKK